MVEVGIHKSRDLFQGLSWCQKAERGQLDSMEGSLSNSPEVHESTEFPQQPHLVNQRLLQYFIMFKQPKNQEPQTWFGIGFG